MTPTDHAAAIALPEYRIEPARGWQPLRLRELWHHRELVYFLIWRDIKVRYKQTALGAAWAIVQPLCAMIVFSVFFGRLAKIPSDGVPYPVFAFCGLLPWQLFAQALSEASGSIVANERLVTKVYFPRLAVPLASVCAALVDFAIALLMLMALMAWYRIVPSAAIVVFPAFVALAVTTALGAGLWLAALNVQYRDVRYTLAFLVQLWLFATPVAYPSSIVPAPWRPLYGLNPMVGVVEGFRWALVGAPMPPLPMLLVSVLVTLGVFAGGAMYFRRMERSFADIV